MPSIRTLVRALFVDCNMDATNHHSADTYNHDAPKGGGINGDDLADVFAIDVESRAGGLGLQSIASDKAKTIAG